MSIDYPVILRIQEARQSAERTMRESASLSLVPVEADGQGQTSGVIENRRPHFKHWQTLATSLAFQSCPGHATFANIHRNVADQQPLVPPCTATRMLPARRFIYRSALV